MNHNFVVEYVDLNEKVFTRTLLSKIRIVIFAAFKAFFDIAVSTILFILLLPLLLLISVLIKLDSKGPVLFRQTRTGKYGKPFTLYKFRTMSADNDVHDFTKHDQHTKIGKILRKTSLDELPQLLNMMKGEMSFIGPRPWITDYYENMTETQRHRYCVRPGLTGLAQVNGRNAITIFDKINYDLTYIKNYSLRQDIKIVFLTIKAVFGCKGADAGKKVIRNELDDLKKQFKRKRK